MNKAQDYDERERFSLQGILAIVLFSTAMPCMSCVSKSALGEMKKMHVLSSRRIFCLFIMPNWISLCFINSCRNSLQTVVKGNVINCPYPVSLWDDNYMMLNKEVARFSEIMKRIITSYYILKIYNQFEYQAQTLCAHNVVCVLGKECNNVFC